MLIGEQIKEARNRMGWNQDTLGDKMQEKMSLNSTVSSIFRRN